jgi:hypothetical protein
MPAQHTRPVAHTDRPTDQSIVVERDLPSDKELESVLDNAVSAQREWKKVPLDDRIAIGERFVKAFQGLGSQISQDLTLQMGRPSSQGMVEVNGTVERAKRMLDLARDSLADVVNPVSSLQQPIVGAKLITSRRPTLLLTGGTSRKSHLVSFSASVHGTGRCSAKSMSSFPRFSPETRSFLNRLLRRLCPVNASSKPSNRRDFHLISCKWCI